MSETGLVNAQRIRALVTRHINSAGPVDQVDPAVLSEFVSIVHRGGSAEILASLKDPFKHGVPATQLRALHLIDRLVQNTPPDFTLCLTTEEWGERVFRTAKTTSSPEVSDRLMLLVCSWHKRYPVEGMRKLIQRFEQSKVVGERFTFIQQDYTRRVAERQQRQQQEEEQRQQRVQQAEQSQPQRTVHADPVATPASRPRQTQRVDLNTLLMDVQGDMAGLEYGIQHPDMLDPATAKDCAKHKSTLSRIVENPAHVISDDERSTVLILLEQLVNLLSFHDAIHGTEYAGGAGATPSVPRATSGAPQSQARRPETPPAQPDADDDLAAALEASRQESMARSSMEQRPAAADDDDFDNFGNTSGVSPAPAAPGALESSHSGRQTSMTMGGAFASQRDLDDEKNRANALAAENSSLQAKVRGIEAEKKDLAAEMAKAEAEVDALKDKYNKAKGKNKEAVAAVEQLTEELQALEDRNSKLTASLQQKDSAPPPEPVVREVVKTVRPTVDGAVIQRINADIGGARKDLGSLRKDARALATVADQFVADLGPRIAQIVTAAGADREKDAQELRTLQALYKREVHRRKEYYNQIQELKGNIRVYCRFRPMSKKELDGGHTDIATFPSEDEVRIVDDKQRVKTYEFDTVFNGSSTQEQVFADTLPLIDSVVDGYNVCIFAYGQTGTGKTHTMNGSDADPGINRRALERLFEVIKEREDTEEASVSVSVLEIYNESIRDLLVEKKKLAKSYDIHANGKFGTYVSNLTEEAVTNADSISEIMLRASSHRSETATNMNAHSSRSHMIVYILIQTKNKTTGAESYGKLSLVDLAGSERLDKSGAEGAAAKEAVAINKSLTALGDTISALSQSAKHVPYRNSTLTHLLSDSMSGQAKVLMFCCASPASYNTQETASSLNFALRARGVSLGKIKKNG